MITIGSLNDLITAHRKAWRKEHGNSDWPRVKKVIIGIQEANEILSWSCECFPSGPNCRNREGFDAFVDLLNIHPSQIKVVMEQSKFEIIYV